MTHTHFKQTDLTKTDQNKPLSYQLLRWLLIVIIALLLLSIFTRPLRQHWSDDYLARGDIYLAQKKYLSAIVEYQKALLLNPSNNQAENEANLAKNAEVDVTILRDFYLKQNLTDKVAELEKAETKSKNPADLARISKELIQAGEYQLAIIPAKAATEIDNGYQPGWIYYGIANLDSSQKVEIDAMLKTVYSDQIAIAKSHILDLPDVLR